MDDKSKKTRVPNKMQGRHVPKENGKKAEIRKNVSERSKDRCPYIKKCGGCRYINLNYEEQLQKKQQIVSKYLNDVASSQKIKIEKIVGTEHPYNYRNKVHSVFSLDAKDRVIRGIYSEASHRVVDIKSCFLEDDKANAIIEEVRKLLHSFKYKVFDENRGTGWLRHVLVRIGRTESENIMLVLVTTSVPFPGKNNFIKAIRGKFPEITTIVQNINDKRTSMVLGERNIVCYGTGSIEDQLLGYKFRISPESFYQVNPYQTPKLYNKVIEYALQSEKKVNEDLPRDDLTVIDAYCGTGTIGLCMASKVKKVIGIELNPSAVKDARSNAKANGIKNSEFVCADATKWIKEYEAELKGISEDTALIMDPPRSGSTEDFISSVSRAGIQKVVYVSCNPETLSRDLRSFVKNGYRVKKITPFDMFPWTEHVETVCLLSSQKNSNQKNRK